MEPNILERSVGGVSLLSLVFGFVGAALGISHLPPMTRKEMFFAFGSGVACAGLLPELLIIFLEEAFGWKGLANVVKLGAVKSSLAFVLGILGMFIIPGLIVVGQEWRIDPVATWKWLTLRGTRPSMQETPK